MVGKLKKAKQAKKANTNGSDKPSRRIKKSPAQQRVDAKLNSGPDGRKLRTSRSRKAIVDAAIELMYRGIYVPTAQQVADEAGISIRSVFRHFDDLDTLYAEIDVRLSEGYAGHFEGWDRSGSLEERVYHAVEVFTKAYTKLAPVHEASHAVRWRMPTIAKNLVHYSRLLSKELELWLPELKELDDEVHQAIDGIMSYEYWARLRRVQGQSQRVSIEIMARLILGIFKVRGVSKSGR